MKPISCQIMDIETSVINKYTDNRISEVYLVGFRYIKVDKLNCEIEKIKQGKTKAQLTNTKYLSQFVSNYQYFRNMEDYLNYMKITFKKENCIVYCHNLSYENSYILRSLLPNSKESKRVDCFGNKRKLTTFRTKNNPLEVTYEELPNVTFKCSLALTNKSVKSLGKELGYNKLDYDYEIERRASDKLDKIDYEYNDRDVLIPALKIVQMCLQKRKRIEDLPISSTRDMVEDKLDYYRKEHGKKSCDYMLSKRTKRLDINNIDFYLMLRNATQGGLTCGNVNELSNGYKNVYSYDFKSSYPYVMCFEEFPVYNKNNTLIFTLKNYTGKQLLNKFSTCLYLYEEKSVKGFVATLRITNLKIKNFNGKAFPFPPLSESKCIIQDDYDLKVINGKIKNCKDFVITLNNVFYDILKLVYNFEISGVSDLYITRDCAYLDSIDTDYLFNLFLEKEKVGKIKNEYKDKYGSEDERTREKELEYMSIKQRLNANYGNKVQNQFHGECRVENGEVIYKEVLDMFDIYDEFQYEKLKSAFKIFGKENTSLNDMADGMHISSMAKKRLVEFVIFLLNMSCKEFEVLPLYCDTDSCKFTLLTKNLNKSIKMVNEKIKVYNENIINCNNGKNKYRYHEFIKKCENVSNSSKHKILSLGTMENETEECGYLFFKTLGAKKYVYVTNENNKQVIHTVIAGCNKNVGEYLGKYCRDNNLNPIDTLNKIFDVGSIMDRSISGRTVSYEEKRSHEEIENNYNIIGYSGKMIESTSYTLNVSKHDFENIYNDEYKGEINNVFLQTKDGEYVLITDEKEIRQYLNDRDTVYEKYIYKNMVNGELMKNN